MMNKSSGFTLIELIIVIAISAIIASIIAIFIRVPVMAYQDTAKRAELSDQANLSIRNIRKDIKMALPNSLRVSVAGNKTFLELITVTAGGKYRSQISQDGSGDILDFNAQDTSFDVLSSSLTFKGGEKIVIANIGSTGYDAYSYDNMSDYNGILNTPTNKININSKLFPLESPSENFYVIQGPITYMCDKDEHKLIKYWAYNISASQPVNNLASPLSNAKSALVSNNIKDCNFIYNQGENSRNGMATIVINLANQGQEVTLYGDTYVRNN